MKNKTIGISFLVFLLLFLAYFYMRSSSPVDIDKEIRVIMESKNDKSFGEIATKGCNEINKDNSDYNCAIIESGPDSSEEKIRTAINSALKQSNVIISVGYKFANATKEAAKENKDKLFNIIDEDLSSEKLDNLKSTVFKEEEGAYLAGISAAIKAKELNSNKIGFIGGIDSPIISRFQAGYIEGAKSVNKDIKVDSQYATSFADSPRGEVIAKNMIDKGVKVIFHASGPTGNGMFSALSSTKEETFGIGVDSKQCEEFKNPDYCLTSVVKSVDKAVVNFFEDYKTNNIKNRKDLVVLDLNHDGLFLEKTKILEKNNEITNTIKKATQEIKNQNIKLKSSNVTNAKKASQI